MRVVRRSILAVALSVVLGPLSATPSRGDSATGLWSRNRTTWIFAEPSGKAQRIGSFRGGTSVALRDGARVRGSGCAEGYHAVEPRGFVCADDGVTLDPKDRRVRVLAMVAPDPRALPYRFAISNGAPLYRRLPSEAEWLRAERDLGRAGAFKKYPWNEKHERLATTTPIVAADEVPFFLENGGSARADKETELVRMIAPLGTTLAFSRAFSHAGRVFLLGADGNVFPADRVRAFGPSVFRGQKLGADVHLPIAWVRGSPALKMRRADDGSLKPSGASFSERTALVIDGRTAPLPHGKDRYLATRERDGEKGTFYVKEADVAVARVAERPPALAPDDKWISVSVESGVLVAYEGARPVFTTLISPGAGGVSRPGVDPVRASTTPRGTYRVQYKYRTQTMSPQKDKPETERTFWMSEVPYAQFFEVPFALHTAYWHESFGEWMSGGCVNLSPEDGKWLFQWTDPVLPPGWDAVWAGWGNGRGTLLVIDR